MQGQPPPSTRIVKYHDESKCQIPDKIRLEVRPGKGFGDSANDGSLSITDTLFKWAGLNATCDYSPTEPQPSFE